MTMKRTTAVLLAVLVMPSLAGALDSPVGRWRTIDDKTGKPLSDVEVYDQGGKIFGKVVALIEPLDDQGRPKTCIKCTGPDKDRPIIGLVIIKELSPAGDRYKGGTIMDPADGKVYKAELWTEDGKLKVRGYLGMFYRTQTWLKAK